MLTLLICTGHHQYAVPPPDGYLHLRYRPACFRWSDFAVAGHCFVTRRPQSREHRYCRCVCSGSYRTYTTLVYPHIFAARVDVVTPVGRAHATIKGKPNLHINRFFTCTVQSNSTRSGRDIYRSLILTRHHGNILALVGTLDNCRIYRRLNRGMRYTLSARRADNKVRLRRQGNRGRIPRCSTWCQGCKIVLSIEILRFFCRQNRARRGTGAV